MAVVAVGLTSGPARNGTPAPPTASPSPTPVRDLDLSSLPIARAPFCDLVDHGTLETALGGPITGTAHYDNGDRAQLAPGVTDVSHEYSCSFSTSSGAEARAWVFAAPVGKAQARALAHQAAQRPGCHPAAEGGPTFGSPNGTTVCRTKGSTQVRLNGLFGDAWFSCQLTRPGTEHAARSLRRAERWCVHLAATVGARP